MRSIVKQAPRPTEPGSGEGNPAPATIRTGSPASGGLQSHDRYKFPVFRHKPYPSEHIAQMVAGFVKVEGQGRRVPRRSKNCVTGSMVESKWYFATLTKRAV